MKKITLSILSVLAFGYASAQDVDATPTYGFGNGDVFVEGALQFRSTNNKNTDAKSSEFAFTPKVGYFVTDKAAIGLGLGFGSSKEETPSVEEKASVFSVEVFGRYYFLELGERFKTYGELGVGFGTIKGETVSSLGTFEDPNVNTVNVGLSLGMNYFITQSVAVSFTLSDVLSYGTAKVDVSGAEAVSEFNGDINVFNNIFATPTIGLLYKF